MSTVALGPAAAKVERHSPCIGVCRLDETTGWCEGCGRSGAEISAWMDADDSKRLEIWSALPSRLARFGTDTRVLPWTSDELIALAARQISVAATTGQVWSVGVPACDPCLALQPAAECNVRTGEDGLRVTTPSQRFSLSGHAKLRGFAALPGDTCIAFGIPKGRAVLPRADTIESLGADAHALDPAATARNVFDLGIGQPTYRIAVRPTEVATERQLERYAGAAWSAVASDIVDTLAATPVTIIVETLLARLETDVIGADLARLEANARHQSAPSLPAGLVPAWAAPMAFAIHPPPQRAG